MRIRLTSVLLAVLLILSLVFLPACAPTAASSAEPTETTVPADLPVMTKIWITPECYQAHPENAVYNAQGDRLCTDGATMEVLEAEGPDINGMSSQRLPDTRQLRFVLTGGSGCGKTTLTRLINGLAEQFYEGTLKGHVTPLGRSISVCLMMYRTRFLQKHSLDSTLLEARTRPACISPGAKMACMFRRYKHRNLLLRT